ncbi:hypothetical protein AVEN_46268-1 [Araneus ventricosus]|uniref:Uncharacterized protein n=1 Tax=Araneus ventricosus TaxID=182803 RepID=A0A4Y1ZY15_ARAVE|nr:hypothetical protein AVEN_35447-1 [Araneus ventricosus]GBL71497.1 hypothetical protein AVEN_62276-1 [Araneus ventricosus]GBL71504.1 hypothetical protein AVEN_122609-1 [Araneus ventricosus]GBL71561.1 hypothetical protein AVEN_46268-1 [Araneus ventricosus]
MCAKRTAGLSSLPVLILKRSPNRAICGTARSIRSPVLHCQSKLPSNEEETAIATRLEKIGKAVLLPFPVALRRGILVTIIREKADRCFPPRRKEKSSLRMATATITVAEVKI